MLLGCPGVGKTPFVIILAVAMGRYHILRSGCEGLRPGWRRAKSLDNFRHRAPQVHEGLFLDDPDRAKVSIADLKSFLTSDEDGTVDSRYKDTRLVRNQVRAFASNDLKDAEPSGLGSCTIISDQHFFNLLGEIFAGDKEKDVLAVLKRSAVFIFAENALRLPSEKRAAIVHRIEDIHKDLLAERDKGLYGKYKGGVMETGPTFDADVNEEQSLINKSVQKMNSFDKVQDYVDYVNEKLQECLLRNQIAQQLRAPPLPSSQSSSEEHQAPVGMIPIPPIGTRVTKRSAPSFQYPNRRLKTKTPTPSQNVLEMAEDAEEQVSEPQDPSEAFNFSGDEDAAYDLGLLAE